VNIFLCYSKWYIHVHIYIYIVPTGTWTVSNHIYIHDSQKKKSKKKLEQVPLQGHTACDTNFYGSRKPLVSTAWANKVSVIISKAAREKQCAGFTVFFRDIKQHCGYDEVHKERVYLNWKRNSWWEWQSTHGKITKNEDILSEFKINPVVKKIQNYRNKCIRHVRRMYTDRLAHLIMKYQPCGKRRQGRSPKRFIDC
jgi:hypothetical protein